MKKIGSLRCENLTDFFKGDKRFSESMGLFFLNKIIEQTQPQAVPWLSHPLNACNWSLEAATITGGKKRSSHDVSQKFGASQKIQSKCWISVTNPHMNCSDTQKKLTGPNKKNGGMHSSIINFDDHLWSPQKNQKLQPGGILGMQFVSWKVVWTSGFFQRGHSQEHLQNVCWKSFDSSHLFWESTLW